MRGITSNSIHGRSEKKMLALYNMDRFAYLQPATVLDKIHFRVSKYLFIVSMVIKGAICKTSFILLTKEFRWCKANDPINLMLSLKHVKLVC